jgi:hypothetical protein
MPSYHGHIAAKPLMLLSKQFKKKTKVPKRENSVKRKSQYKEKCVLEEKKAAVSKNPDSKWD